MLRYPTFVVDLNDNKNTVEIKQYRYILLFIVRCCRRSFYN